MATWSSVACCEEADSAQESVGDNGVECQVTLRCAYESRWLLLQDIVDSHKAWPKDFGLTNPPLAIGGSARPAGSQRGVTSGQSMTYPDALVTIRYATSKYKSGDGDVFSEVSEPSVEFITLDYRGFRWGPLATDDLLTEKEAPGRQLRMTALKRTWYDVAYPVPDEVEDLLGYINDAPYTSAITGRSYATHTLLFAASQTSRKIKADGSQNTNVDMTFIYKPDTWDKYWRAKTQTFEKIYLAIAAVEYMSYPEEDFSVFLF